MAFRIEELNDANCKTYLVTSGATAALVDPVRERTDRYLDTLREQHLTLEVILETHTHADHLMIGRDAKIALGTRVLMHRESPSPLVDEHVDDGTEIPLGRDVIKVLHTPGHTPDSVSYVCGTALLTGDALLIGGSGRTDFAGGDPGASYDSVTTKLFRLPDHFAVWPAHDYKGRTSSTIGDEKHMNPRFAGKSRDEYIALMSNLALSLPERVQQVLQVNQSGFEADEVGGFPLVTDAATVPGASSRDIAGELRGAQPPLIIDVREPEEFVSDLGHIEGALLIPMDALVRRLPKLAGYVDRSVVVVCRAGARSRSACAILRAAGFRQVRNLEGGMLAWADAQLPVSR